MKHQDITLQEPAEANKKRSAIIIYQWLAIVGTTGMFLHWLAIVLHYVVVKPEMLLLTHLGMLCNFLLVAMVVGLKLHIRRTRRRMLGAE